MKMNLRVDFLSYRQTDYKYLDSVYWMPYEY